MTRFPSHTEPDGDRFAAHHFSIGLCLCIWVLVIGWDDIPKEPQWMLLGLIVSAFSFLTLWHRDHPAFGAFSCIIGLLVATVAVFSTDALIGFAEDGFIIGIIVMWDDVVEHAFGIPTPLDTLYERYLYRVP